MQSQLNEIRNQQRDTWNKFSGGWKKWDEFTMNFLKPMGVVIIKELNIKKDDKVLDIASGTGEPALTIAQIATEGKVVAADIAEKMLDTAKENAQKKGVQNFETVIADASELPFESNSFDKISCRMGFMFFPDMQSAANEMYRVLKDGGKMATCVWHTPQKNTWITGLMSIINKNIQLPPAPEGAPSMFRCAAPGFIKSLLQNAGFKNIKEQEVNGKQQYENFDYFWTMTNEVAAPVVNALSNTDDDTRNKIKNETEEFAKQNRGEKGFELEFCALVVSAEK